MVGLERDKQATDPAERNTVTFRVLKDRFTGNATGFCAGLRFDPEIGVLTEAPLVEELPETDIEVEF